MKKFLFTLAATLITAAMAQAKTLVVYYSFTNNVHTIVSDLSAQIEADMIRVQPAEKGLDYAANGYAIGSAQIQAIRSNPNDASSYPDIDPVEVNLADYDMVIVATPLWWSNMAAPMQAFLFKYGSQMAGKNIGLIVSSASSGISDVVADAKRLIPRGRFASQNLWIRSAQTTNCHSLIADWLKNIDYGNLSTGITPVSAARHGIELACSAEGIRIVGEFKSISLFTISGSKVAETSDRFISTTSLPAAIYIAQIEKADGKIQSQKIAIVH